MEKEKITCGVCLEMYSGIETRRCPRTLCCGHTFCTSCIQKLIEVGSSYCPTCKMQMKKCLKSISINFTLMLQAVKYLALNKIASNNPLSSHDTVSHEMVPKEDSYNQKLKNPVQSSKGFCDTHKIGTCLWCMTCHIWVCVDCVASDHKLCKAVVFTEALLEMKKEQNTRIKKLGKRISKTEAKCSDLLVYYNSVSEKKNEQLEGLPLHITKRIISGVKGKIKRVTSIQSNLTQLKGNLECQTKILNWITSPEEIKALEEQLIDTYMTIQGIIQSLRLLKMEIIQQQQPKNQNQETTKKNEEVLHHPDHKIEELLSSKEKMMSAVELEAELLVIPREENFTKYGTLEIHKGNLRILSFKHSGNFPSSSLYMTLSQCLTTMTGKRDWPKKVFLQFCGPFDVVIRLNEAVKEASQMILHAFLYGFGRLSPKGRITWGDKWVVSRDSMHIPSFINGETLCKEKVKTTWEKGEFALNVYTKGEGMEFDYWIWVEESGIEQHELIPAGVVVKGIHLLPAFYKKIRQSKEFSVRVVECGWTLD